MCKDIFKKRLDQGKMHTCIESTFENGIKELDPRKACKYLGIVEIMTYSIGTRKKSWTRNIWGLLLLSLLLNENINVITRSYCLQKTETKSKIINDIFGFIKCNSTLLLTELHFWITTLSCKKKKVMFLEFCVPTCNTEQYSHFPFICFFLK
jgi:hypothetical protein